MSKVTVIGGGAWGSALASVLAGQDHDVTVLVRRQDMADALMKGISPRLDNQPITVPRLATTDAAKALTGADAVLVTVGVASVYDLAPRYLANRGKVVMVGMPHFGQMASYSPLLMADMGQSIVGSKMGDVVIKRDIPWMVDLYNQGRLKLDELITGRWQLEQVNEAIADTMAGHARRNVIVFK